MNIFIVMLATTYILQVLFTFDIVREQHQPYGFFKTKSKVLFFLLVPVIPVLTYMLICFIKKMINFKKEIISPFLEQFRHLD
jgi:hypothetical protein